MLLILVTSKNILLTISPSSTGDLCTTAVAAGTVTSANGAEKGGGSSIWGPDTWKSKRVLQIPVYPNQEELDMVLKTIESFPPLVISREARKLGGAARNGCSREGISASGW